MSLIHGTADRHQICRLGRSRSRWRMLPQRIPQSSGPALTAGEKLRTAFPTKMLKTGPAVVTGLGVDPGRFPHHPDLLARADHGDPVRRSGQRLAIRAMTDRDPRRIDLALIGDQTAMALPVDIHL